MIKKFFRQTPFGIFIISLAITLFFIAISLVFKSETLVTNQLLNFAQSEKGLVLLTALPTSILLLEILLRKLDRHSTKITKPMGVEQPSASYKSLIRTLNQKFNKTFLLKDNQSFKHVSLWATYGN